MAHSLSAKKRIKQNETRRMRNRARISGLRTEIKKFDELIHDREVEKAQEMLKALYKQVDQIAAKGTLHSNTAARRKSRLTAQFNKMQEHAKH